MRAAAVFVPLGGTTLAKGKLQIAGNLTDGVAHFDYNSHEEGTKLMLPLSYVQNHSKSYQHDTLVVEMNCNQPVGIDESGQNRVCIYLTELSEILSMQPLQAPCTHLSPKYGLSGWIPLIKQSAVHLYIWDKHNLGYENTPPFVSIDISITGKAYNLPKIITHAKEYFCAQPNSIVYKTMLDADSGTWKELAPHILRQRIMIVGTPEKRLRNNQILAYLQQLCGVLKMDKLSEPIIQHGSAWMHWEASGIVASWNEDMFNINIYTCRQFRVEDAIQCTSQKLCLNNVTYVSF